MKDFLLSDAAGWQGQLVLTQWETSWDEDVCIRVRSLDGKWFVTLAEHYYWREGGTAERELSAESRLSICKGDHSINLIMVDYPRPTMHFIKFRFDEREVMTIGRAEDSTLFFDDPLTGLHHARLENNADKTCTFVDSSKNGSYLNGRRVAAGRVVLHVGDIITVTSGLKVVYLGDMLAVNQPQALKAVRMRPWLLASSSSSSDRSPSQILSQIEYHRAPRLLEKPYTEPIEIEAPLTKQEDGQKQPLLMTLGPSLTMVLPMLMGAFIAASSGGGRNFMASGLAMVGTSSALATMWALASVRHRKNLKMKQEKKRTAMYVQYIEDMEKKLRVLNDRERKRLVNNFLSVKQCSDLPDGYSYRLWERMPSHSDFLTVRFGAGQTELPNPIQIPPDRLSLVDDPMSGEPARLKSTYAHIANAPITADLRALSVLGIMGGVQGVQLAQSLIVQICALHSYNDVKLAVIYDDAAQSKWAFTKWLPHVFPNDDRRMRMSVSKRDAIYEILSYLDEILRMRIESARARRDASQDASINPLPHYVVVCSHPRLIQEHPIMRRLVGKGQGFTLILLASDMGQLPKECEMVARLSANAAEAGLFSSVGDVNRLDFEYPSEEMTRAFAKRIAPIRVRESGESAAIPTYAAFLDAYSVKHIEDLDVWRFWSENKAYEGLRSIIGIKAGGQPFVLDISERYHGPHGLLAGTTGSGKSVTLQTYILSLALNYHPRQVQFVLVDYKGGGMSDTFAGLPHVSGMVDNLQSERTIFRALSSIQGEIHRRETAFKRARVNNIDDYIRLYGQNPDFEPYGHLIIVVDEFAELKKEQPEFMHELISASRVGRSVGLHLILATQKPSNSVDDEIRSNTRFRICLRVADRSDSMDMLRRPDAAYAMSMGRCFVQVGNDELFEQVQTLYSGGAYRPDAISEGRLPRLLNDLGAPVVIRAPSASKAETKVREFTEMDAVLLRIDEVVCQHQITPAKKLWMNEVARSLTLSELPGFERACFDGAWPAGAPGEISATVALGDDVERQLHIPVDVNLTERKNHLIVGMASSGKTTFLQTLAMALAEKYAPDQVQMYFFSLSSRALDCLSSLPHVGGLAHEDEPDEQRRLLGMLARENERRKALFAQAATDSFPAYARAAAAQHDLPAVSALVVMVDRIKQAQELMDEAAMEQLSALMREGSGRGIFFIVTALSAPEMPFRLQNSFYNMALENRERGDYGEVLGTRIPAWLSSIVHTPGRGLTRTKDGVCEMQTALFGAADSDAERAEQIRARGALMSAAHAGARPARLMRIPTHPTWRDLMQTPGGVAAVQDPFKLPMGYDTLTGDALSLPLDRQFTWLFVGASGSGKTNLLRCVARTFLQRPEAKVHVVSAGTQWANVAEDSGARVYAPDAQAFTDFLMWLQQEGPRRGAARKAVDGDQGDQVRRSFAPIVLLLDDLDVLLDKMSLDVAAFLTAYIRQAGKVGFYIFATISASAVNQLRSKELFIALCQRQAGVLLSGKPSNFDLFAPRLDYRQKNQLLEEGRGLLIDGQDARHIVLVEA